MQKERVTMFRIAAGVAVVILVGLNIASAQSKKPRYDMLRFYAEAESVCTSPAMQNTLKILCKKKVGNLFVTFVGTTESNTVLLASVTQKPINNVQTEISLLPEMEGARATVGKTSTWGYVFDRNHDGKIDYLALLGGAMPIKDKTYREDIPPRGQGLDYGQLEYYLGKLRLVFNHWADDNFDDSLDAAVHIDLDPERDWVERQIVLRSNSNGKRFSEVWAFRNNNPAERETIDFTPTSVSYHPVGQPSGVLTPSSFKERTDVLQLLNFVAKECKLGEGDFFSGELQLQE